MRRNLKTHSSRNNRRFIPVLATAVLFFIAYGAGAGFYQGMREPAGVSEPLPDLAISADSRPSAARS